MSFCLDCSIIVWITTVMQRQSMRLRTTSTGLFIKNCWYAMLLPTRQNWPYPKNFMAILRKIYNYIYFFFKNLKQGFIFTKLFFPKPFLFSDNVLLYCFNFNISYFEPYTSTNIHAYQTIKYFPTGAYRKIDLIVTW